MPSFVLTGTDSVFVTNSNLWDTAITVNHNLGFIPKAVIVDSVHRSNDTNLGNFEYAVLTDLNSQSFTFLPVLGTSDTLGHQYVVLPVGPQLIGNMYVAGGIFVFPGNASQTSGTFVTVETGVPAGYNLVNAVTMVIDATNAYSGNTSVLPNTLPQMVQPVAGFGRQINFKSIQSGNISQFVFAYIAIFAPTTLNLSLGATYSDSYIAFGRQSLTQGQSVNITHGLGVTPSAVISSNDGTTNGGGSVLPYNIMGITASQFTLKSKLGGSTDGSRVWWQAWK